MRRTVTGYHYCACRDCPELIVGEHGDLCDACDTSGCDTSTHTECQAPDAYGDHDAD